MSWHAKKNISIFRKFAILWLVNQYINWKYTLNITKVGFHKLTKNKKKRKQKSLSFLTIGSVTQLVESTIYTMCFLQTQTPQTTTFTCICKCVCYSQTKYNVRCYNKVDETITLNEFQYKFKHNSCVCGFKSHPSHKYFNFIHFFSFFNCFYFCFIFARRGDIWVTHTVIQCNVFSFFWSVFHGFIVTSKEYILKKNFFLA